ncbi:terminase large subunit [uncultured Mucilaginibacter sp.]|uniref:PBSX family phage terminase large subunit n=1 Tax=uncultured Mucilaginibacter sp. TaxID=797541 RepID=UPI0025F96501|nr:terminase large subunit [uncultured Mucilaginibacter sp.]
MQTSVLFKFNYESKSQIIVNQGGTSSGKTYALIQVLLALACEQPKQVITIVGQDIPNLKSGAMRDAQTIISQWPTLQNAVKSFNKSDRVYELHNGSLIEFKSYDNGQDAKSGKRDYLFINEANGITWDIYTELALRTRKRVYLDYNPNAAFWVHDELLGKPGVELLISDHRHNPFCDEHTRQKIENLQQSDPERWKVYARGLTGKITGLVITNWVVCETIPPDAKKLACGLDFGFTNDETGLLEVYKQNGELWVNELLYETGLTNQDISERMTAADLNKNVEIIADSAEPKSIEELRRLGWRITGAKKGTDSIKNSIDILRRYRINVTRSSVNLRRELGRYQWKTDSAGKTLNIPTDSWNHLIDPLRYVALNKLNINGGGTARTRLPYLPQNPAFNDVNGLI